MFTTAILYRISISSLNSDLWLSNVIPILLIIITIEYNIKKAIKLLTPQSANGANVSTLQITIITTLNCFKVSTVNHI